MESCVADVLIEAMKKKGSVRRDFDRIHNKQSLEKKTFNYIIKVIASYSNYALNNFVKKMKIMSLF